ncbi:30S ribosomal protein S16 [Candidatus Kuenenbacteria bacterium]|nr:30S ribosomal protein S16 [Candidatus Kuenenbacteria bacterium]
MLMIRLSRVGKTKQPTYRIIVQDKSKDPWGKALEFLGNYNPHTKDLVINKERLEYWRGVGAQMSASINNLLIRKQIIRGKKVKTGKVNTKKRLAELKKKEDEKKKQEADAKAKAAAEAKAAEEAAAKAAEEAAKQAEAEKTASEEPVAEAPVEEVKEETPVTE